MISGISIEFGLLEHWKQGGTALGLSLGPYHILLPKVVNIALALLEPVGCLTVSAFGTQRRLVPNPTEVMDEILGVGQRNTS